MEDTMLDRLEEFRGVCANVTLERLQSVAANN